MKQATISYAAPLLVLGCVVFGLGSLIVKFVQVGPYAVALWRLAVAALVFWLLMRRFGQKLPQSRRALRFAAWGNFKFYIGGGEPAVGGGWGGAHRQPGVRAQRPGGVGFCERYGFGGDAGAVDGVCAQNA